MSATDHNDSKKIISEMTLEEAKHVLFQLLDRNEIPPDRLGSILKTFRGEETQKCPHDAPETLTNGVENNGHESNPVKEGIESAAQSVVKPNHGTKKKKAPKNDNSQKRDKLFETCRVRHVALRIAYDGSSYGGFAENVGLERQSGNLRRVDKNNPIEDRGDDSIEYHVFSALQKICLVKDRYSCQYSRCGRTDKGVSAFGQVIGVMVRSAIPSEAIVLQKEGDVNIERAVEDKDLPINSQDGIDMLVPIRNKKKKKLVEVPGQPQMELRNIVEMDYPRLLNAILPPEIRVIGWCPVSPEFSARFSAKDRTYRYFFAQRKLNIAKMQQGLDLIIGKHDFRNLCKLDTENVYNFERRVFEARVVIQETEEEHPPPCESNQKRVVQYIEIRGQAFLWHMIRHIVEVAFLVGKELETPSIFTELLDVQLNPGKPNYPMASELPLVLHRCDFQNLTFGHGCSNLWELTCHFEQLWEDLAIRQRRLRDWLDSLKKETAVSLEDIENFGMEVIKEKMRKKRRKNNGDDMSEEEHSQENLWIESLEQYQKEHGESKIVQWDQALNILFKYMKMSAGPVLKEPLHTSLMERSRGTTYEEKVNGMKGRRKERYQENVIKKRKTTEEDRDFYDRMARQGGRGV